MENGVAARDAYSFIRQPLAFAGDMPSSRISVKIFAIRESIVERHGILLVSHLLSET